MAVPPPGKIYPLGLVGESKFQAAIRKARPGMAVHICHEPDNPHDPEALRFETAGGATIGYIARDSWLRDAIFSSQRGCSARIKAIDGSSGKLGVVIDVQLNDAEVPQRSFAAPPPAPARAAATGTIARLIRGIVQGLR